MLKTKPQPGTKIRCIDNGGHSFLTKGKIYEVVESRNDTLHCFHFIDDDGDWVGYWLNEIETEDFELVQEDSEVNNIVTTNEQADEFQVGDVVWCVLCGKGEVRAISQDGREYPLHVVFDSGDYNYYTLDGKYLEKGNRSLFFSEPKIEAATTRPFVPTLVGKKVVVREYACYPQLFTVTWENENTFGDDTYSCVKANCEVYEVSSENLLKK